MAKSDKVTATVADGRSVDVDGVSYGPGKQISISAADATSLRDAGFLAVETGGNAGGAAAAAKSSKAGDGVKSVKPVIDSGPAGGDDAGPGATTSSSDGAADPSGEPG